MHGTPRYMAPERLRNEPASASSDVFSLGMVLYEMLTGRAAVSGANAIEIMHNVTNEPVRPPSQVNPEIDAVLDQAVLTAIHKSDSERYPTAAAMKQALEDYLTPSGGNVPDDGPEQTPLAILIERMSRKSNFPALSQTIGTINRVAADSDESVQTLSSALLKDFALTNNLLKLVNSTIYGQFGSNISTISRAVMILGFNAVRDLAVTLILFEHMQNKAQATQLKEDVIASYFTGIMAHRIAKKSGIADVEEGFICGVFHNLGRMLATYYFYDESVAIATRMRDGESEAVASRAVLGVSHEELGIGVASHWNLPEKIVNSMQRTGSAPPRHHPNTSAADRVPHTDRRQFQARSRRLPEFPVPDCAPGIGLSSRLCRLIPAVAGSRRSTC